MSKRRKKPKRVASEMFSGNSNYLKTQEVPGPIVRHIADVQMEKLGQGQDAQRKPVIYWQEDEDPCKPMVCNVTNWNTLIETFGENVDSWVGEPVEVYTGDTQFGGKPTKGLRIRAADDENDPDEDEEEEDEELE